MALAKHYEEIIERRARNGARVIFEYQHSSKPFSGGDTTGAPSPAVSRIIALRAWMRRVTKECNERLAREMTAVYKLTKLDGHRVEASPVGYMTKGEAAKLVRRVVPGELLDLDNYGGMFVRADHLFISEGRFMEGIERYGDDVLEGLLREKKAA